MKITLLTECVKMLKRLEWAGYQEGQGSGFMGSGNDGKRYPACPICNGIKPKSGGENEFCEISIGHNRRCSLKKLIKEIGV